LAVRIASTIPPRQIAAAEYAAETDERLIEMFRSGDASAFHYLIDRHRGLIRMQIHKFFGATPDAEDIMQDISLSLWQKRDGWKPGLAKFSTWLYKVVANRCIDLLRQKKEIMGDNRLDHIVSSIISAEDRISESQISSQLRALLADLPEQQRTALKLFYYDDTDISQICVQMRLSDQAVRSLLKRGKQKLRHVLQPDALRI